MKKILLIIALACIITCVGCAPKNNNNPQNTQQTQGDHHPDAHHPDAHH